MTSEPPPITTADDVVESTSLEGLTGDLGLSLVIEAMLFVADRSLTVTDIAGITGAPPLDIEQSLDNLQHTYADRGIVLIGNADGYRFVSSPQAAPYCRHLLGLENRTRLSRASLETLGIVAYKQPVTRAQIENIRGVEADSALATLLTRGLIEEVGRLTTPGRPVQFGTSDLFLAYFGIPSLTALPELDLPEPETLVEPDPETGGS